MDIEAIEYQFRFRDHTIDYKISFEAETFDLIRPPLKELPEWAKLEYCKCSHCTLNEADHPCCPLATALAGVIYEFKDIPSYEEVDVSVVMPERTIAKRTTAQKGISSLIGLITPASGCPHTIFFRPMARFHLPFSTHEDTVYRATSMYLLARFFQEKEGAVPEEDFEGLKSIYNNIHKVNVAFSKRLRTASEEDSSVNAIIILDLFTRTIPKVIEDQLDEIRYIFKPFLS